MTVTRAMADMESVKHEIAEMMKKMEECETSINRCMNTKCDAMEANIKKYINATVCAHIDGIFKRLNLLSESNLDKTNGNKSDTKLEVKYKHTSDASINDDTIVVQLDNEHHGDGGPDITTGMGLNHRPPLNQDLSNHQKLSLQSTMSASVVLKDNL